MKGGASGFNFLESVFTVSVETVGCHCVTASHVDMERAVYSRGGSHTFAAAF